MQKIIYQPTIYEMKCDICGKEESIKHESRWFTKAHYIKYWTEIRLYKPFDQRMADSDIPYYSMDLCPKCAKKLKKLIMAVELESED
jgi:predicted nucleic acid-binding Zn ribbon protein